ncbi:hypothetical protein JAO76_01785 [Pontibacter sp. BT310]|uniref:RHS repeat-associated core domain-containing protein n=1 Tax=Pontibacter populi TaxID=890055 RepID=A0ABS6X9A6_9BACT|nr:MULTISPECIES: hypothetical protein [Pontibacter]MBJ6116902.1 hypothetical protein [Pontibacter sp. BT310]MBR0569326.1 hypothetical protein [Microvirga sp. STS03]MBW3363755.1 hypothetical protein [Pontibacter populi]
MKLLTTISLLLGLGFSITAQAQTADLNSFVKRFDYFLKTNTAKLSWSAKDSANTMPVPMPNAMDASKTRIPDPTTGLWHYPNLQKVYDPKTGFYIDYEGHRYYSYKADTVAGKIFKGKDPVQIKRTEKVQNEL